MIIYYCIRWGLGLDKVKLILDRTNIDPDLMGAYGRTPLMMACSMEGEDLESS
jgi:hypothetical protein